MLKARGREFGVTKILVTGVRCKNWQLRDNLTADSICWIISKMNGNDLKCRTLKMTDQIAGQLEF